MLALSLCKANKAFLFLIIPNFAAYISVAEEGYCRDGYSTVNHIYDKSAQKT